MKVRSMVFLFIGTVLGFFLARRQIESEAEAYLKEGEKDEEPEPGTCKPNLRLV